MRDATVAPTTMASASVSSSVAAPSAPPVPPLAAIIGIAVVPDEQASSVRSSSRTLAPHTSTGASHAAAGHCRHHSQRSPGATAAAPAAQEAAAGAGGWAERRPRQQVPGRQQLQDRPRRRTAGRHLQRPPLRQPRLVPLHRRRRRSVPRWRWTARSRAGMRPTALLVPLHRRLRTRHRRSNAVCRRIA